MPTIQVTPVQVTPVQASPKQLALRPQIPADEDVTQHATYTCSALCLEAL